jgi:primosomal protein N'
MGTIDKILNLLKMNKIEKSYSVKFYAEMKLDDGRIIATEDDQFMIGSKVFAVGDDGEADALAGGSYTMENGNRLLVSDDSKIEDLGEEAESVEEEDKEASEETLAEESEAEDTDWAKTFEEMKDRLAKLEDKVFGEKAEEETEELSKEKTEMSTDVISELMTQVEELNSKIVELSNEPATDSIKYNPEGDKNTTSTNLSKLSSNERVAYYINNLK